MSGSSITEATLRTKTVRTESEQRRPTPRKVLERIVVLTGSLADFLANKVHPGYAQETRAKLAKDLWNGAEPHFTEMLTELRQLVSVLRETEDNIPLVANALQMPEIPDGLTDVSRIREALRNTARLAQECPDADPSQEKMGWLESTMFPARLRLALFLDWLTSLRRNSTG